MDNTKLAVLDISSNKIIYMQAGKHLLKMGLMVTCIPSLSVCLKGTSFTF